MSGGPITRNGATLPAAILDAPARRRRARATDEQLAHAARRGDTAAFAALFERHHRPLLSFARHMLGDVHDAEDVVQHTFLVADREFRERKVPKAVRAWLYTVARNRCLSLLRARREPPGLPDVGVPSIENLAAGVEQREDLRRLLADVRALPDEQRAALLLSELGDLSHAEVAKVIGVRPGKVKALVFQARETLMAAAHARAIPCRSIQHELAVATGAQLRRRHLRNHLAQCAGCREYADRVRAQRASLALILPVIPTLALRDTVLSGLAATTGGGATAGGVGLVAAKSTAAKLLAITAVGGAAAGGGTIAITTHDATSRDRASERREQSGARTPATTPVAAPLARDIATRPTGGPPAADARRRSASRGSSRRDRPVKRADRGAPVTTPPAHGQANGHRDEPAGERTPPGQSEPKPPHGPSVHAKPHKIAKVKQPRANKPKPNHAVGKPAQRPRPEKPPKTDSAPAATPPAADAPGQARKQAKDAAEAVTGG